MEGRLEVDAASENEDDKERELNVMTFDPQEFVKALCNKGEIQALKDFKKLAEHLKDRDVVLEFLHDSGSTDGTEFTNLFKQKRPMSEIATIFEALEVIFLRIADDLQDYHSWGIIVIRRLVQPSVMRNVYHGLAMTNTSRHIKATINFLTSMVAVSSTAAKEVASRFNFKEHIILPLLSRSNIKDANDVRTSTICFLLSFLMVDDNSLIQQLMDQKRILNGIFPNLIDDKAATIQIVLNTLKSQVIENKSISKTSKVRLFNANTLKFVFHLFNWSGPKVRRKEKRKVPMLTAAEKEFALHAGSIPVGGEHNALEIHQLTQQFLIAVCCSYKNGIIFLDRSVGTSGSNCNHVITNLLSTIGKPYVYPIVERTVIEILKTCPDQMVYYIPTLKAALLPRPTSGWVIAIAFLIKVLKAHDLVRILNLVNYQIPAKMLGFVIMNVTTTSVFTRDVLKNAVRHSEFLVRNNILLYFEVVLKQANRILGEPGKEILSVLQSKTDLKTLQEKFIFNLSKFLPSVEDLLHCWNLATCNFKSVSQKNICVINECLIVYEELFSHLVVLIGVISTYVNIFSSRLPHFVDDMLLGVNNVSERLDKAQLCEIQMQVFELLSNSQTAKFLLIKKVNDKPIASLMCEMISTSCKSDDQKRALHLLKMLMVNTGLFQSTENEIDLWLKAFLNAKDISSAATFVQTVLFELVSNPQMYLDLTSGSLLKVIGLSTKDETNMNNTIFDEILNEDGLTEDSNNDFFSAANSTLPHMSLMIVASLKALEKNAENSDYCKEFVASVFNDILHCQHHPEIICHLFQQYRHVLPTYFLKYLPQFSSADKNNEVVSKLKNDAPRLNCETLGDIVRLMYEMKSSVIDVITEDHFKKLKDTSSKEEKCIVVQQILLYLKFLLNHENKDDCLDLVSLYCEMLRSILMDTCELCDIRKEDQVQNDNCDYAHLNKVIHLILNHPVIHETFLHPHLLDKESSAVALWELTKLTLTSLNKLRPTEESSPSIRLLQEKMEKFMLMKFSLLQKNPVKERNSACSLVEIVQPFLNYLEVEILETFVDILCKFSGELLFLKKKSTLKFTPTGKFLIHLLDFIIMITPSTSRPILKSKQVSQCANLYIEIMHCEGSCEEGVIGERSIKSCFGTTLLHVLESNNLYALAINQDFLEFCLEDTSSKTSLKLADMLLQNNLNNLPIFHEWVLNSKIGQDNQLMYVDLVMHFLDGVKCSNCFPFSENYRHSLKYIKKLYWPLVLHSLFKLENSEDHLNLEVEKAYILLSSFTELNIIGPKMTIDFAERCLESTKFSSSLASVLQSSQKLFIALSNNENLIGNKHPVTLYVILCLKVILALNKSSAEHFMANVELKALIDSTVAVLEKDQPTPFLGKVLHGEKLWHSLIMTTLKIGLRDENGADMLNLLKAVIYRLHHNKELVRFHASSVFELILGHSNFLSEILDASLKNIECRESLLDLLLFLVKIEPSVCRKVHIPIFLASYRATLHRVDQKILLMLYYYENQGVDVHSHRPFIWGSPAIEHYAVLKNLAHSLWKQPSMETVLHLLNSDKLLKTALNFPLTLKLQMETTFTDENCVELGITTEEIYDPRFLLSLFSSLLAPESLVHCHEFINCNGLAFVFATLGSEDDKMRAVGYHLLANFYQHLEGSRFIQKMQWLYLLDCVRNAIETPNAKLSSIITVFLIKTCHLLLNPVDELAKPVTRFLFLRPALDIWNIPDFYYLFSNPNVMLHSVYRSWVLSVISQGLRSNFDYRICQKRYIFKIILAFFGSPTTDHASKLQILNVLKSAVKIRPVVIDLFSHHGVLVTIHAAIKKCNPEILSELIDILNISWKTLNTMLSVDEESFIEKMSCVHSTPAVAQGMENRCSLLLSTEFLMSLLTSVERLSLDTSVDVFAKCLSTLSSVLNCVSDDGIVCRIGIKSTITTTFVKQLLLLYFNVVDKAKPKEKHLESSSISLRIKDGDGEFDNFEDFTENTESGVMDLNHFIKLKQCHRNMCEVLLHWKVVLASEDCGFASDMPNYEISKAAMCADVCDTFASVCHLLLKSLSTSENSVTWLKRVYTWLNDHLLEDKLGNLTISLINATNRTDIFSHLFKKFEFFLSMQNENIYFDPLVRSDYESTNLNIDVIVQLSKLFTILLQNLSNAGYNLALQNTAKPDAFIEHLFHDNVKAIFNLPVIQNLIRALNEDDRTAQHKAAIPIAILACELWLQVEEMENFLRVVQRLLNSHIDNLVQHHDLSNLRLKKTKRKSSQKSDKVKRKRLT